MHLSSRKVKKESKIELQMTSMIDMVFLLLIFFMATSSFIRTEKEIDSAIKVKSKSSRATSNLEPAVVEIVRGAAGSFVFKMGSREIESSDELETVLARFGNKFDGAFVRPEDEAPFEMAATALRACKSAKFVSVTYVPHAANP